MSASHAGTKISVVLPAFNEAASLKPLLVEVVAAMPVENFEVIVVDDGSRDGSAHVVSEMATADPRIRSVKMSENRGQSAALLTGFQRTCGEIVVTLDADGQNDPADIPALISALDANPEVAAVVGVRRKRFDTRWKRLQGYIGNRVRDFVTGDRVTDTGCSLRAVRRRYIVALPSFDGMHRFIPTLIRVQGGLLIERDVGHRPRRHGASHYGAIGRATRGLRDAFRVRAMVRQQRNRA